MPAPSKGATRSAGPTKDLKVQTLPASLELEDRLALATTDKTTKCGSRDLHESSKLKQTKTLVEKTLEISRKANNSVQISTAHSSKTLEDFKVNHTKLDNVDMQKSKDLQRVLRY